MELANPVADRHATERSFFAEKSPWNSLDKDRVGIDHLRARLQEILADHIRREFPKVKPMDGSMISDNHIHFTGQIRDYQETKHMPAEFAGSRGKASNLGRAKSLSNGDCYGISEAMRRRLVIQLRTQ